MPHAARHASSIARTVAGRALAVTALLAAVASAPVVAASGSEPPDTAAPEPAGTGAPDTTETASDGGLPPRPLDEPVTLTVGVPGYIEPYMPVLLADAFGEFERENLTVEFVIAPEADTFPQLGSGEMDVVLSGVSAAAFNAIDGGVTLRGVMPVYSGSPEQDGLWLRNEVLEGVPDSLRGAVIASGQGPKSHAVLPISGYLVEQELSITDVEIRQFPLADIPQALENGAVDGAYMTSGSWRLVGEFATQVAGAGNNQGSLYYFGPNLLEDDRAAGLAFLRAIVRTHRVYLQGDYKSDDEVVDVMADVLDLDAETLADLPSYSFDAEPSIDPDYLVTLQEIWLTFGDEVVQYDEALPADRLLDLEFLTTLEDEAS